MPTRFFPNYDKYIITSPYGMRTLNGTTKMHNGIDLVATRDGETGRVDHLTAHTGGIVEATGYDSSAGYFINIRVSPDTVMVYYHLREQSPFKAGDAVKQGDRIGYMGKTGKVTGAHLHWGIKKNGNWIDPAPYLNKDYVGSQSTTATPAVPANKTVSINMEVLREGMSGEQVETLQRLLQALDYKMVNGDREYGVDGSFGAATGNAVEAFQRAMGLDPDRVVGKNTWSALLGANS